MKPFTQNNSIYCKKSVLFTLFFVCFNSVFFGQDTLSIAENDSSNISKLSKYKSKRFAANYLRIGDTYSAIRYYENIISKTEKSDKEKYILANLYLKTRDYKKAEVLFQYFSENLASAYPESQFMYARMLKANQKYSEAKVQFSAFSKLKFSAHQKEELQLKKQTKIEISSCDIALKTMTNENEYAISHLNKTINTPFIESSPILIDSSFFIYISTNIDSLKKYPLNNPDSIPFRKIMAAKMIDSTWNNAKPMSFPFNNEFDIHNMALNPSKNRLYFSKCLRTKDHKIICELWISNLVNNVWEIPVKLENQLSMPSYTSTMPTVGLDKKKKETVYFSSNRPGGKGGMDIWYSAYDEKKKNHSKPKHAGKKINSLKDELTPFYDIHHNSLYFSSSSFGGFGELDVFKSIGVENTWSAPENIGASINTGADELYYTQQISTTQKNGFFISNRVGGTNYANPTCCDDIYAFKSKTFVDFLAFGKLTDGNDSIPVKKATKTPLDSVNISLFELKNDTTFLVQSTISDINGLFNLHIEHKKAYRISYEKIGYLTKHIDFNSEKGPPHNIDLSTFLKELPKGSIVISNIYYETAKATLTNESIESLNKELVSLLLENNHLIIEISSHTDNVGSDRSNQSLSQARAESVIEHLIKKGISKERLIAKGYGESVPISSNDDVNGRQKNRRTEFKIIGYLKNIDINYED